jgi:hypothetical protein
LVIPQIKALQLHIKKTRQRRNIQLEMYIVSLIEIEKEIQVVETAYFIYKLGIFRVNRKRREAIIITINS